jgi:AAA family ATPase
LLVLEPIGYPFRLRGDPKAIGVETESPELFSDYAREQWLGSFVHEGMFLFDRYVMPDFAFRAKKVVPDNSIVAKSTRVRLEKEKTRVPSLYRRPALEDVIGHEDAKRKCRLLLKYLESPHQFGEWAPRAVLFHGPPGTGKTLTARAVANEAQADIFITKASDLIGVHVGDGGRKISTLFESARASAPSIIFIDELDAIGLARTFQSIRGDVSEVVTALLGEMDQTVEESGVILIGATNAVQMIDSALRSRFDTVFEFGLPNKVDRLSILKLYSSRLPIRLEMDLHQLASLTEGLSGRDLRDRLLKESLHVAISKDMNHIPKKTVLEILNKLKKKSTIDYAI